MYFYLFYFKNELSYIFYPLSLNPIFNTVVNDKRD